MKIPTSILLFLVSDSVECKVVLMNSLYTVIVYKMILIVNVAINGVNTVATKLSNREMNHFPLRPFPVDLAVTMYMTIMLTETITAAET